MCSGSQSGARTARSPPVCGERRALRRDRPAKPVTPRGGSCKSVKSIAGRMAARLPASITLDDLIGAGSEGLMDAVHHYSPETGVPFPAYAAVRIRGAMLDQLRRQDWPSRSVRKKTRRLEAAEARLEQELSCPPRDEELAEFLGVSVEDVHEYQIHATSSSVLSLDGLYVHGPDDPEEEPFVPRVEADVESRLERQELLAFLCEALEKLPWKGYLVLALYYYEGLVMREIGKVLQVSEAAVSLRHTAVLSKLRKDLWQHYRLDEIRHGI